MTGLRAGMARLRLGVNVDHVATVRNARGGEHPDPVWAAALALDAGADGIVAHLREDRRHIRDADVRALAAMLNGRGADLNLEMAVADEVIAVALEVRPPTVMLVPERREERTTEGGLDLIGGHDRVAAAVGRLRDVGSRVSVFVEPDLRQVQAAAALGVQVVELHTGAYCDAVRAGRGETADRLLARLRAAAAEAHGLGLEIHAGHGIDYDSVGPVARIPHVAELNIGHFLIGEAIFTGLPAALARMRGLMDAARSEAREAGS